MKKEQNWARRKHGKKGVLLLFWTVNFPLIIIGFNNRRLLTQARQIAAV